MTKIKYVFRLLSIYWNLKQMAMQLGFITCVIVLFSFLMKDVFVLLILLMLYGIQFVTFMHSWFYIIKPTDIEVKKELELEAKYSFLYRRFTN